MKIDESMDVYDFHSGFIYILHTNKQTYALRKIILVGQNGIKFIPNWIVHK